MISHILNRRQKILLIYLKYYILSVECSLSLLRNKCFMCSLNYYIFQLIRRGRTVSTFLLRQKPKGCKCYQKYTFKSSPVHLFNFCDFSCPNRSINNLEKVRSCTTAILSRFVWWAWIMCHCVDARVYFLVSRAANPAT